MSSQEGSPNCLSKKHTTQSKISNFSSQKSIKLRQPANIISEEELSYHLNNDNENGSQFNRDSFNITKNQKSSTLFNLQRPSSHYNE